MRKSLIFKNNENTLNQKKKTNEYKIGEFNKSTPSHL
jgi:hypothetical protein